MTGPPPCPRRTNANLHPAAPVIAAKQTRRSSEEREAELEAIHKLELELEAQAQQNEENAARPPPAQSTPSAKKTGYVLARSAPLATMTAKPPSRAAGTDDNDSASQVGVFTQSTGASDLNDFEDGSSALIERPATLDVATDRLGTASVAKTKAKQKLSEYRNGVANEAIIVVTAYMLSKRFDTSGDRAEYVAWALSPKDNWPFRFERVVEDEDGKVKTHGAYQGTLISRTFAYHLKRINLCGDQIRDHPCNALALTTTAVERALLMWSSGSLVRPCGRTEEAKFSERLWGKTANEYLGSIIDLTDEQWDSILAKADLCKRGLHVDSDDELEDEEHPEDLPTTGRAVLMDADLEEHERECFAPMALASDDAKAF
ncbi:hypothetical protein V8D89_001981 [Ganoderma adspersum]